MFLVDTNIFLYAANIDATNHEAARTALNRWREGDERWFATWSILYEFLRVATHRNVFAEPFELFRAWTFVRELLASPSFDALTETGRHAEVMGDLVREYPDLSGNIMHDVHTAAIMREHGVTEIRTNDSDFERFTFLRVVNPLDS